MASIEPAGCGGVTTSIAAGLEVSASHMVVMTRRRTNHENKPTVFHYKHE